MDQNRGSLCFTLKQGQSFDVFTSEGVVTVEITNHSAGVRVRAPKTIAVQRSTAKKTPPQRMGLMPR
jgi:hypothetical protein